MGAQVALGDAGVDRDLDNVRNELDALDRQLVALLARRFEIGREAARLKRALGIPVHDPAREEQVILQAREWARTAGLPADDVETLFRRMIDISRAAQLASGP
jgi:prephenate dehydrogenase